jgi:lipopolysaccharide transport system ATP-binding protein
MSDAAIRLEHIGKRYRIVMARRGQGSLQETVTDLWRDMRQRLGRRNGRRDSANEDLWALKDVSLECKRGEVVGLIGRNGAGKSTLLKILTRITEPTTGHGEIEGRVGSLLEVGTGFHPELSGRDNVYLNGAILGMRRAEIQRKFDEIVAFAEIGRFIDTPVKRYSSGMYTRLAFAVAAHLEPEILLVDEVLAVGDISFQKRCLGKMEDVGRQGRTVVFVSHNLQAITRLCPRAILLDEGKVLDDGPAARVVGRYMNSELAIGPSRTWPDPAKAPADDTVRLCAVRVRTEDGSVSEQVDIQRPVGIEIEYDVLKPDRIVQLYFRLWNDVGVKVIEVMDVDPQWRGRRRPAGRYVTTGWVPGNLLNEGRHFVGLGFMTVDPLVHGLDERDVAAFQVLDSLDGTATRGEYGGPFTAAVRPLLRWTTRFAPNGDVEHHPP